MQQVAGTLPCQRAEQVLVARRPTPALRLLRLIVVFDTQVGVLTQLVAYMRRGEQVKLDAGGGRAVRVQRDQHLGHAFVSTRLRHHLQHETQTVPIDEELLGGEVGRVGEPGGELLGGCVGRGAEAQGFEKAGTGRRGAWRRRCCCVGGAHGWCSQSVLSAGAGSGGSKESNSVEGRCSGNGLCGICDGVASLPSTATGLTVFGGGRSGA